MWLDRSSVGVHGTSEAHDHGCIQCVLIDVLGKAKILKHGSAYIPAEPELVGDVKIDLPDSDAKAAATPQKSSGLPSAGAGS